MSKRVNLLEGNILKALISMSLPIMATSLLQMAYNMTDMIWIGRMGSNSVAAIGAAGMFVNLAGGLSAFARVGGQVRVAQSYGGGEKQLAATYARNAIQVGVLVALCYSIVVLIFFEPFIGFFRFTNQQVILDAQNYLRCMGIFMIYNFINPIFTALITATGNSKTPFKISTVGLVINMCLDPLFIFGLGPIPAMGVIGAAIATVIAQSVVCILYIRYLFKDKEVFRKMNFRKGPEQGIVKDIAVIGLPASIQGIMFTGISMVLGRIVASWGETAIAVQKVGIQVESISYMAADGFAAATNSFIAQNYGGNNMERAKKGYKTALGVMMIWGVLTTAILIFFPGPIFKVFIPQADILPLGMNYLIILGFSQFFMCIEILTAGAFSAYGKTLPPSIVSIVFTAMRIPLAMILGATALGLNGVWWSISISSIVKGILLLTLFTVFMHKRGEKAHE
ncbi:MAG: MATE family efflux transporter [Lachnospiraceae bacterium]